MFGKPKEWKTLSETDRAWAKSVTNWNEELARTTRTGDETRVSYILKNYTPSVRYVYRAVCAAIEADKPEGVKQIFANYWFNFSDTHAGDTELLKGLFRRAAGKSVATQMAVHAFNLANLGRSNMSIHDVAREIIDNKTPWEVIEFYLKRMKNDGDAKSYFTLVNSTMSRPVEDVEKILACAPFFKDAPFTLSNLMCDAINGKESANKIKAFLHAGADAAHLDGKPLAAAIDGGQVENTEILLSAIVENSSGKRHILEKLNKKPLPSPFGAMVAEALGKIAPEKTAVESVENGFTRTGDDTLSVLRDLPGMQLTTVFNFTLRMQTQIIQKDGALAMTTSGFHEADSEVIESMRQKLVAMGGKAEPFIHVLPKGESPLARKTS